MGRPGLRQTRGLHVAYQRFALELHGASLLPKVLGTEKFPARIVTNSATHNHCESNRCQEGARSPSVAQLPEVCRRVGRET